MRMDGSLEVRVMDIWIFYWVFKVRFKDDDYFNCGFWIIRIVLDFVLVVLDIV